MAYPPQDQYYDDQMQEEMPPPPKDENVVIKNTPWWAISLMVHLVAFLALWSVVLSRVVEEPPRNTPTAVKPKKLEEPPKIKKQTVLPEDREEEEVEDPTEDPKITKEAVDEVNEDPTNNPNDNSLAPNPNPNESNVESPYPNDAFNSSIGLGGNVGGGGGPSGNGGMKYRRARGGGGHKGDQNVLEALYWLRDHQSDDGSWSPDGFESIGRAHGRTNGQYGNPDGTKDTGWPHASVGLTGLSLLAFLGAGYTHQDNEFANTVKLALRYLKNVQENDGCFGSKEDHHFVYNHSICAMAMAEAYAMTGSSILKGPAQKAVDFIGAAQNQDPDQGWLGWRYGVKPGDNDSSVTGWMMLALKSAKMANLTIEERCWDGGKRLLDMMTGESLGYQKTGYITRGGPNARLQSRANFIQVPSMDAINVLSRLFIGEDRKNPVLQDQARTITREDNWPTADDPNKIDYYYWYYASLAMFQMGGRFWEQWETPMIKVLTGTQCLEGDRTYAKYGSWDAVDAWGPAGGRVYSTAINCLTLEVYYRYEFLGSNR